MNRKFDDYEADVVYDVWMSGGNVDLIDNDDVRDYYEDDCYPEETAQAIVHDQFRQTSNDEEYMEKDAPAK